MPNVENKCTTHHFSTCDCIEEKILDVCEAVINTEKYWSGDRQNKKAFKDAKDITNIINSLKDTHVHPNRIQSRKSDVE